MDGAVNGADRTPSQAASNAEQRAWSLAYAAAKAIGSFDTDRPAGFRLVHLEPTEFPERRECPRPEFPVSAQRPERLQAVGPGDPRADLLWHPARGWECASRTEDAARTLLDLYLPISSATQARPVTVAHLGQSLDGFIATPSGDSSYVTGPENILHLHRLRALCDAVVVGAGTVSADNPQLTTRLVSGSNPVRVILDPACRLPPGLTVFSDRQAETLRVCAAGNGFARRALAAGESLLELAAAPVGLDLAELMRALRARGYHRVLIEGGGVTVSSFLQANLIDRLHIAIAPVLIGEGRPAVRLPPRLRLQDCLRLRHRVYRSGGDILFDCDLRPPAGAGADNDPDQASLQRIL